METHKVNTAERNKLIDDLVSEEQNIVKTKAREYSRGAEADNDGDTLQNFKEVGNMVTVTCPACTHNFPIGQRTAWMVYFLKHVFSVLTHMGNPSRAGELSEPMKGRFLDLRTYAGIGHCIDVEEFENSQNKLVDEDIDDLF